MPEITELFGGGDSVSIEVVADRGSIYSVDNLSTIKHITHDFYLVKGVIPYTVRSLATLDSGEVRVPERRDADATMLITPLMPQYPKSAADAKADRSRRARDNPLLNGVLVSKDGKASLVVASFRVGTTQRRARSGRHHRADRNLSSGFANNSEDMAPGITIRAAGTPDSDWMGQQRWSSLCRACLRSVHDHHRGHSLVRVPNFERGVAAAEGRAPGRADGIRPVSTVVRRDAVIPPRRCWLRSS